MKRNGQTIAREVSITGIGLHTGKEVKLTIKPREKAGIVFVREDLSERPEVRACISNHVIKLRRTVIRENNFEIHTPEHLLGTLYALGIDRAEIGLWGLEVPGLDGSAKIWAEEIALAGFESVEAPPDRFILETSVAVTSAKTAIVAIPHSDCLEVEYILDHDNPVIPPQRVVFEINPETFVREIAPCRTFVLAQEVEALQSMGLGKGANYSNTLVIDEKGIKENTLRFQDEFARHKLLDFIGDLSLFESQLQARIVCLRSGHKQNAAFVKQLYNITEK